MTDNERLFGPFRARQLYEKTVWRYRLVWHRAVDEHRREEQQRPLPAGYEWLIIPGRVDA